jgi:hypothetical protein
MLIFFSKNKIGGSTFIKILIKNKNVGSTQMKEKEDMSLFYRKLHLVSVGARGPDLAHWRSRDIEESNADPRTNY